MSASRVRPVRSIASKRTEWWNVAKDRSDASQGRVMIRKAAVRRSNGTFVGATNYAAGKTIRGSKIEA